MMTDKNSQSRVLIFDTTLRDGEQSPGATMTHEEKLEIATMLDDMGVDIIEAGFPIASEGDFAAVSEIARLAKNSTICGLARATRALFRRHRRKLNEYPGEALSYQVLEEWSALGLGAAILGSRGGDPDYRAGNRQLGGIFHEGEQHEHLVPQVVATGRGDEDATVAQMRHESRVQGGLGIDIEREDARTLRNRLGFAHRLWLLAKRPR